jgi:S-adenosylmethionine-diacylgycerolhomoserine-N-methlytransferase
MSTDAHAEHLDRNYRYQRHVYDLTREYYLLGRRRLIAGLAPPPNGSALNLIRAQRRFPNADYFGVDLSRMMLETADAALRRRGLRGRIRLALGDATDFDARALLGQQQFDRVFFSYSLSMIPPWQGALEHAVGLLAEKGSLHIVDFGGCEALPLAFKRTLYAWLAQFRVTPREELEAVLRDLARRHALTLSFQRIYRGYSYYAVLSRA